MKSMLCLDRIILTNNKVICVKVKLILCSTLTWGKISCLFFTIMYSSLLTFFYPTFFSVLTCSNRKKYSFFSAKTAFLNKDKAGVEPQCKSSGTLFFSELGMLGCVYLQHGELKVLGLRKINNNKKSPIRNFGERININLL